jgi:hypothetical protein
LDLKDKQFSLIFLQNQSMHTPSWKKGDWDVMILNVDENALTNPGMPSFGGFVHNFDGTF